MDGGLLSLKWNNHRSTFFYVLSNVRKKECYTDVTLACEGKFYPVHKLILSTCSEYFEQMFEQTQCKHPVIVLKDIRSEELESLLSYMYVGEVNVVQEKLSGLIKAAECLRIKGLAVPDEEPCTKSSSGSSREKRTSDNSISSEPKRRRQDDSGNFRQNVSSNSRGDDRRKSFDHQSSSSSNKYRNSSSNNITNNLRDGSRERGESDKNTSRERLLSQSSGTSNSNAQQTSDVKAEEPLESSEAEGPDEVTIDEPNEAVKQEPADLDAVYLSDSNSASESKDILMDNFGDGDGQQHFMDELLGQNSGSDQGHMGVGDFVEGGEGSSSAPSSQQQHMVGQVFASFGSPTTSSVLSLHPTFVNDSQEPSTHRNSERTPSDRSYHYHHDHESDSSHSFHSAALVTATSAVTTTARALVGNTLGVDSNLLHVDPQQQLRQHHGASLVPFGQLNLADLKNDFKKYQCPVCSKVSKDRSDFRRHYMTHTGEKPFICPFCSYRACHKSNLMKHINCKHFSGN